MTMRLIDHFLALLIQVLSGAGLLDVRHFSTVFDSFLRSTIQALICMLEESPVGSNLSRKAVLLLAEVLQMSNRVLPLSIAAQIQVCPSYSTSASPIFH